MDRLAENKYRNEELIKKLKEEIVEINLKLSKIRPDDNVEYSSNREYFDLARKGRKLKSHLQKEFFKPTSPEYKRKVLESDYNQHSNRKEVIEIRDRAKKLFNSKISIKDDNYIQEIDAIYNFILKETKPSRLQSLPESKKLSTKSKKGLIEYFLFYEDFSFPKPTFLKNPRWRRLLGAILCLD